MCIWQIAAAGPGLALLALCAVLPLVLLVRRPGPRWLAAALAPVLGLAGLAGAFPALAGQAARWRSARAAGCARLLVAAPRRAAARRGCSRPSSMARPPSRRDGWAGATPWESSLSATAAHAIAPPTEPSRYCSGPPFGPLPPRSCPGSCAAAAPMLDALAAILWATALAAGGAGVGSPFRIAASLSCPRRGKRLTGALVPSPRGVILGAPSERCSPSPPAHFAALSD